MKNESIKKKVIAARKELAERENVKMVLKYKEKYNLKLGVITIRKDEYVNKILEELIEKYGIIHS